MAILSRKLDQKPPVENGCYFTWNMTTGVFAGGCLWQQLVNHKDVLAKNEDCLQMILKGVTYYLEWAGPRLQLYSRYIKIGFMRQIYTADSFTGCIFDL